MAENENTFVILQSLLTCVCVSEKTMGQPRVNGGLVMGKLGIGNGEMGD